jgi:ubiquinol-cytochrome c reductase iron-sulfur subunit
VTEIRQPPAAPARPESRPTSREGMTVGSLPPAESRPHPRWPAYLALLLTVAGGVGFAWSYVVDAGNSWLGGFLALGLLGLGFALAYWGRDLAGDEEASGPYPIPDRDVGAHVAFATEVQRDAEVVTRRGFLTAMLVIAAAVFGLSQVFLVASLGPRVRRSFFQSDWREGLRLVTFDGRPITSAALATGGFLVAFPEGHTDSANSQVVLIRPPADRFTPLPGRESWSPEGFVAYSRVCTHAGCAVAQYEDEAQVLLCPCHQSTFDVLVGAKPIGGPAGRALPQLPLAVNGAGELMAQSGFTEPVGPKSWTIT